MARDANHHPAPEPDYWRLLELSESGLLWLINRTVFHPRGLALALYQEGDEALGWKLLTAPSGEPFTFPETVDNDGFRRAEATIRAALTKES
ncbi:hypothetical protein [Streptomyces asoensis]|uniref:Uncharacterized protein n=1 Tax=Streptomyces asoensis TaxID=249586 RepID=A0ABQ3RYX3_9ACTN|nr:hypothetical protein [Streptomyces asoensis]GGQ48744.1 hypothetical protein GCM10010496_08790 [Streptomyces asoensis]GHI61071.1 hypothetical protein Saso_27210 [Streptomyces asoensis]